MLRGAAEKTAFGSIRVSFDLDLGDSFRTLDDRWQFPPNDVLTAFNTFSKKHVSREK
jgi:hypothetical protein